jgi:hypothetical protein
MQSKNMRVLNLAYNEFISISSGGGVGPFFVCVLDLDWYIRARPPQ